MKVGVFKQISIVALVIEDQKRMILAAQFPDDVDGQGGFTRAGLAENAAVPDPFLLANAETDHETFPDRSRCRWHSRR